MQSANETLGLNLAKTYTDKYLTDGAFTVDVREPALSSCTPDIVRTMASALAVAGLEFRVTQHPDGRKWHIFRAEDYRRWVHEGKKGLEAMTSIVLN